MKIIKLPKDRTTDFIEHLKSFGEVHAPQKKGKKSCAFQPVTDPSKVLIDEEGFLRAILPLKKYFHKPVDTLLKFSPKTGFEDAYEEEGNKVIFGVLSADVKKLPSSVSAAFRMTCATVTAWGQVLWRKVLTFFSQM
jgi:hypothetical protein